ncbi:MAG: hypothetical protein LBK61_08010 [Spirochaetaceae bacterium]|nr:hypothetical protein [Spirochaetaceae bacterium]
MGQHRAVLPGRKVGPLPGRRKPCRVFIPAFVLSPIRFRLIPGSGRESAGFSSLLSSHPQFWPKEQRHGRGPLPGAKTPLGFHHCFRPVPDSLSSRPQFWSK